MSVVLLLLRGARQEPQRLTTLAAAAAGSAAALTLAAAVVVAAVLADILSFPLVGVAELLLLAAEQVPQLVAVPLAPLDQPTRLVAEQAEAEVTLLLGVLAVLPAAAVVVGPQLLQAAQALAAK